MVLHISLLNPPDQMCSVSQNLGSDSGVQQDVENKQDAENSPHVNENQTVITEVFYHLNFNICSLQLQVRRNQLLDDHLYQNLASLRKRSESK